MRRINTNTRESGQALVEYILILMIVVLISIGLLYQFNKSVRDYTNIFFGEYIACLVASGQLPSLGSEDNTGCTKPSFSFNSTDLEDTGVGRGGDSSSSSDSNSSVNNRAGLISSNGGGGSRGVGGASTGSNSVPISDSSGSKSDDNQGDTTDFAQGRSSRVVISNDSTKSNDDLALSSGRVRNVPISLSDDEAEEAKQEGNNQLIAQDQIGQTRLVPISQSEGRRIDEVDSDVGLNMAGFIKWLLIIGIIIAIVVLLFMQALQIKKGLEK